MNCILLTNTNIYDLINIYNIIDYLSKKYNILYVLVENSNINFSKLFFNSIKNIYYLNKDNIIDLTVYINDFITFKKEKHDIIKLGNFNNNWEQLKDNIQIDNMPINYFDIFYKQLNLNYVHCINYKTINRNYENEDILYDKFKTKCSKSYIFTYNLNNLDLLYYKYEKYDICDLYDSLTNIKSNEKWLLLNTDNIMDYLKIIENADELHINDLSMLLLLSTIDLNHIKIKYAYTNKFFLKTYFKELKNWKFIYN
jgi:hypothetical protein